MGRKKGNQVSTNKKRRTRKLTNWPGLYEKEVWSEKTSSWVKPVRGCKFGFKISRTFNGRTREIRKEFDSFSGAKKAWAELHSTPRALQIRQENPMTFGDLIKVWLEAKRPHLKASTLVRYDSYFKHFKSLFDVTMNELCSTHIDQLLSLWKSSKYLSTSQPTRMNYDHEFSLLSSLFRFYEERSVFRSPIRKSHYSLLKVRSGEPRKKDLTKDEVDRFFAELKAICPGKYEPIFYLAQFQYWSYCRVQEAAALHFEDFDKAKGTLTVRRRIMWIRAKGQEDIVDSGLKASETKEIPFSDKLRKLVLEWRIRCGKFSGAMFEIEGRYINYRQIEYRYSKALAKAGIPFRGTHLLRHASLTEAYATTNNILVTRDLAGHTDMKSTQKYAKARRTDLADAMEKHSSVFANRT